MRLRALLLAARDAYQTALDRGREVLARADRVVLEEPPVALPPAVAPARAAAPRSAGPPRRGWRAS
jgi:hypothetical protein